MAIITRISAQKSGDRFNIFLDDGSGEYFGFGVDQDVFVDWKLKKGKKLTEEDIAKIKADDEVKKAFHLSLQFLSYRMRSEKEMSEYLQKKGYQLDTIKKVLEKLRYYQFINDATFANQFIQSKKNTSMTGPLLIKQQLAQKGVSHDVIDQTINEFSKDEQVEKAIALIEKKLLSLTKFSTKQKRDKLTQYLLGKGYPFYIIEEALAKRPIEQYEDLEWDALVVQANKLERKYAQLSEHEFNMKMKQALYRKGFPLALIDRYLQQFDHN